METRAEPPLDIGALKRLKVLCISETGWRDTSTLLADIKAAGGVDTNQYEIPWPPFGNLHPENAAGSSALIELEGLDGAVHKFLFDTGWNAEWMDRRFAEEGVDALLQRGEIECLVISHEHFDHFWGIEATLKLRPDLTLYVPRGFHDEGFALIKQAGHTGETIVVDTGRPLRLFAGAALVHVDMKTLGQVQGENVLYFNVADKGLAMATGCGHGGVTELLDYARRTFAGGEHIHAVYGGLHISPFDDWDEKRDETIRKLAGYGIARLGCNHCTGERAVRKMIDAGLPVVRGSASHGSKTDLYLGNGDVFIV
jgi:7,8-dihydropterin-6-yl-methyl-4-(beta-D-ribofuranosyl)aminobenzene 5'-phosphate synthase